MLPTREFRIPRRVVIGSGSSAQVGEECQKLGVEKSLIVTDQVMVKLGILEGIKKALVYVTPFKFLGQRKECQERRMCH